jgi:hypothetical protein
MHARVALYRLVSGSIEEVAQSVESGLLPIFQNQPGFHAYDVAATEDRTIISFSTWERREDAEAANAAVAGWVKENLEGKVELLQSHVAEIVFSTQLAGIRR